MYTEKSIGVKENANTTENRVKKKREKEKRNTHTHNRMSAMISLFWSSYRFFGAGTYMRWDFRGRNQPAKVFPRRIPSHCILETQSVCCQTPQHSVRERIKEKGERRKRKREEGEKYKRNEWKKSKHEKKREREKKCRQETWDITFSLMVLVPWFFFLVHVRFPAFGKL